MLSRVSICEPARQVPVRYDVDVIVASGGLAGFAATVTLACMDINTLLVELHNAPG